MERTESMEHTEAIGQTEATEQIEEIGFGGLKLIQSSDGFRFGIDAVLLADFAAESCRSADRIVDLGTGNGVIPLILSHKTKAGSITGIDLQAKAIELARRSCALNGLEDRIRYLQCDVAALQQQMPQLRNTADAVVSNPPYIARGAGLKGAADSRFLARQETTAGIEEFTAAAAFLLRDRGHFFLVHRPSRLVDLLCCCRKYALEPKNIRFVAPRRDGKPNIMLLHCVKGGGKELDLAQTLYVYDDAGGYTLEIMKIYEKTR